MSESLIKAGSAEISIGENFVPLIVTLYQVSSEVNSKLCKEPQTGGETPRATIHALLTAIQRRPLTYKEMVQLFKDHYALDPFSNIVATTAVVEYTPEDERIMCLEPDHIEFRQFNTLPHDTLFAAAE